MTARSLDRLRAEVLEANLALVAANLVTLSFGNASGVDRDAGVLVIKPSGVPYDQLRPADLVVVALDDEHVVEGTLRPSSDTPTHALLYRRFPSIGGVVHTHSPFASAWAQAGRSIPHLGTTHADHFDGPIPVTRPLTADEIDGDYERETGEVVVATLAAANLDPLRMPAVLVRAHGPFTWGRSASEAARNAVAIEAVAAMAYRTLALEPGIAPMDGRLLARHFHRKHGPKATYGQAAESADPAREPSG
jgi:L-ribulose-5-phosphate 4-epimerase